MKKFRLSEFIKNLLAGAAVAVLVFSLGMSRGYTILRCFTDAWFVAAVLLLGLSGIKAAVNDGSFDTMGYSMKTFFGIHFGGSKYKDEDIMEYKERKAEKRKPVINLLLTGSIFLVLALLFLVLYSLNKSATTL